MDNQLKLNNIDDLIYMEDYCSEDKSICYSYQEISSFYLKKLKQNKKQMKNNSSFFIYDYRPQFEQSIPIENPAIQPHDSSVESVTINQEEMVVKGSGTSYMNDEDYLFEIKFNDVSDIFLTESFYYQGKKEEMKELSFKELNSRLSQLNFKEVFLDQSAILKPEINFVFVEYSHQENEKRNVIVLKLEYGSVHVKCKLSKN